MLAHVVEQWVFIVWAGGLVLGLGLLWWTYDRRRKTEQRLRKEQRELLDQLERKLEGLKKYESIDSCHPSLSCRR